MELIQKFIQPCLNLSVVNGVACLAAAFLISTEMSTFMMISALSFLCAFILHGVRDSNFLN